MSSRAPGSRSEGRATSILTAKSMWSSGRRVEDEVVGDFLARVASNRGGIEDQFGLDCGGDVIVEVLVAGEVQLSGDELKARRGHLQMQMCRAPGMPAGCRDEPPTGAVGGNLIRRRLDGVDLELALIIGNHGPAEIPLRHVGCILAVKPVVIGLPDLELRAWDGLARNGGHLTLEEQRGTWLVGSHRQGGLGRELGGVGNVIRALYSALAALSVLVGDLLDDMLNPNI